MRETQFRLNISASEFLAYYQGAVRGVVVKSLDGTTVQFPANVLRPFVTHDGVRGLFAMRFDGNNKFVDIRRVDA